MDLSLSDDQRLLKQAFTEFFAKESTPSRVRESEPVGFAPVLWGKLVEVGAVGLAVAEEHGGGGGTLLDLALVVELAGRSLAPAPLVDASVAARLLSRCDSGREVLVDAIDGRVVAFAPRPAVGGVARMAPPGAVADAVVALDGDELVVAAAGESPRHLVNLGDAPLGDWTIDRNDATVLAVGPDAERLHRGAVAEWRALTAALLVGMAAAALDLGVGYAKARHAFGQPIGRYQAVAHPLAADATLVDGARLLAYEAAWAIDEADDRADALARMAYLFAGESSARTSLDALRVHGGYGFMEEYDVQLYYRRTKTAQLLLGSPRHAHLGLADVLFGDRAGKS